MIIRSFSIATSIAVIVLCGCGGSASSDHAGSGAASGGPSSDGTSSGGVSGEPVPGAMLGSVLASAYCPQIAKCCASVGIESNVSGCTSTLSTLLDAQVQLYLGNAKIAYDAVAARNCVEAYRAASTACTDRTLSAQLDQACKKVFTGKVPPGGSCASGQECLPAATGYASCDTAICVLKMDSFAPGAVHAQLGEPCSGTCSGDANNSSCSGNASTQTTASGRCWLGDGLFCGTDNTCQTSPKIGQACGNYDYCEAAGHCHSGMCVADTADGDCTGSADNCLPTSYCDTSTAVFHCAPRKANGVACNDDDECIGGQCEQDHCRNFSVATKASCAGILDD